MKRPIRSSNIIGITSTLKELQRLRRKAGFKKISEHKRQKLRDRIRYQLHRLRARLSRFEGIYHATDPETWDVHWPTAAEQADKEQAWATIVAISGGLGGRYGRFL